MDLNKNKILIVGIFLLLIFLIGNVVAESDFIVKDNSSSFQRSYKEGDLFKGEINISFENYLNSEFSDDFGNSISVLDFLSNSSLVKDRDYSCEPMTCKENYRISEVTGNVGALRKDFKLDFGTQKKVYGIILKEKGTISDLKFNVSTNAYWNSSKQFFIDLLDDGIYEYLKSNASSESYGNKNQGCFNKDSDLTSVTIPSQSENKYYCEKINFTAAPGYVIGAKVIKMGDSDKKIYLRMTKLNGDLISSNPQSSCERVPENGIVECNLDYLSKTNFEALVCISSEGETQSYEINSETDGINCGGYGNPKPSGLTYRGDYDIYALPRKYAAVGTVSFSAGSNLKNLTNDYLRKNYGEDCPDEGCIIPIAISTDEIEDEQSVSIYAASLGYESAIGKHGPTNEKIYELEPKPVAVSMNSTILQIERLGFVVPNALGRQVWNPKLGDVEILRGLNRTFYVDVGFTFDISPKIVLIGRKTYFTALGFTNKTITSSSWDFGDGSLVKQFNGAGAEHTYTNESSLDGYSITVTLVSSGGESSTKKFRVIVGNPKESANRTIVEYQNRLDSIGREITTKLSANYGSEVKNKLGYDGLVGNLTIIRNSYTNPTSTTDDYYKNIVERLLRLNVPYKIDIIQNGALPVGIGFANINPVPWSTLMSTSISSYDPDGLKRAIYNWMGTNYDVSVIVTEVSIETDSGKIELMKVYKVSIVKKAGATSSAESNLIINYPANDGTFKSLSGANVIKPLSDNSASYAAIDGQGIPGVAEFAIEKVGAPDVEVLGVYMAPLISELGLLPLRINPADQGGFQWILFFSWTGILLFIAFVVYIILSYWYKMHYEHSLFKNSQDLYNLINFIYNARRSGLSDSAIKVKLQEKKWKNEQIIYGFKKIDGKRTGMWEIPLFKFLENRKVKQEIEKQQGGKPVDVRFIKRPGY